MTDHRLGIALTVIAIALVLAGPLVAWARQRRRYPKDSYIIRYRGEKR